MEPNRPSKSSSSECTYTDDLTDIVRIREELDEMARENAAWLKKTGQVARTVTIKVRYDDFTTITRSHSSAPTDDEEEIVRRALRLLDKTEAGRRPVRLLGAGVHNFGEDADTSDGRLRLPFE